MQNAGNSQQASQRLRYLQRSRRRVHGKTHAHEERVAKVSPKLRKHFTHGGLVGPKDLGDFGQALEFEQEAQRLQMSETDFPIIHFWNSIHAYAHMD
jgi:hypothetical protein